MWLLHTRLRALLFHISWCHQQLGGGRGRSGAKGQQPVALGQRPQQGQPAERNVTSTACTYCKASRRPHAGELWFKQPDCFPSRKHVQGPLPCRLLPRTHWQAFQLGAPMRPGVAFVLVAVLLGWPIPGTPQRGVCVPVDFSSPVCIHLCTFRSVSICVSATHRQVLAQHSARHWGDSGQLTKPEPCLQEA